MTSTGTLVSGAYILECLEPQSEVDIASCEQGNSSMTCRIAMQQSRVRPGRLQCSSQSEGLQQSRQTF